MTRRPGMTPEQHVECGQLIETARDALMRASAMVCKAYGTRAPAGLMLYRMARAGSPIDGARCLLDNLVFSEMPRDRDPRGLAKCVYYGWQMRRTPDTGSGAADAFAGYELADDDAGAGR